MSQISGININDFFNSNMDAISNKGAELEKQMQAISDGGEVGPEQMLALQFEMGQYNALLESISTVTKSLTDSMKSIAQRAS